MFLCWLPWSRATEGNKPWDIYTVNCNYPPVVPYFLTVTEQVRLAYGAAEEGRFVVTLVKLPNLIAAAFGVFLFYFGLRGPFGEKHAYRSACAYLLCLPLLFNAAVWGQYDALLSLAVAAAAIALIRERPIWAGAAMGFALVLKFQAIVVVPIMAVYAWRRLGAKGIGVATATGLLVLAALLLPYILGGAARGVLNAYTGAADLFQNRTIGAYNGWYLLDRFDITVRKLPWAATRDTGYVVGAITYKHVGLTAFGAYVLFLAIGVWRRPTCFLFVFASALSVFGFFMLPTQMHERYVLPALALLVLITPLSREAFVLFLLLSVTSLLNQMMVMDYPLVRQIGSAIPAKGMQITAVLVSLANIIALLWATRTFWRIGFIDTGDTSIARSDSLLQRAPLNLHS